MIKKILMLTAVMALFVTKATAQDMYALCSEDGKTLTLYYDKLRTLRTGTVYCPTDDYYPEWTAVKETVTKIVFDPSFANARPTKMHMWFAEFGELESIEGMENLNTSEVTDMRGVFYCCRKLKSIDLSHFDTSSATNMFVLFAYCESLTSIDVSHFDTSNVKCLAQMFLQCTKLTWIDINNFDISNVREMDEMFKDCNNLTTIYCENDWSEKVGWITAEGWIVQSSGNMFLGCTSLCGDSGFSYDEKCVNAYYAKCSPQGYFSKFPAYAVYSDDDATLTFYRGTECEQMEEAQRFIPYSSSHRWQNNENRARVRRVVIDPSFAKYTLSSMSGLFFNFVLLEEIVGMENLNTSELTETTDMFNLCRSLREIDLTHFDISACTNISYMFDGCEDLTTIYCNNDWNDISRLTYYYYSNGIFRNCKKLKGGKGTPFDENFIDIAYARPDGGPDAPGYFTKKAVPGDVNGDGTVDVADIATVISVMANTVPGASVSGAADVNGDGNVDVADIATIISIMAGK